MRIGYAPFSRDLKQPGDRRRFCYYAAKRGLPFEIADPEQSYDVVVLTEASDVSIWRKFPRSRGKVIYDLVDSYLAIPQSNWRARLRGPAKFAFRQTRHLEMDFRRAIEEMCLRSDAVICSTLEQKETISRLCPNVHPILDFQTSAITRTKTDYRSNGVFNLVWEGQGGNLFTFGTIKDALREIASRHPIAVHLVTDLYYPLGLQYVGRTPTKKMVERVFDIPNVYLYEWNEAMFATICTACDLGVIPIPLDNHLYRGKPENKLLIFWRMGLPVVTSATPAYKRAMQNVGLDMSCATSSEWVEKISAQLNSEERRRDAGARGKAYAEANFSEERLLSQWDAVFDSLGLRS